MKYYKDPVTTLYNGDCRSMSELADESVQMVVTSPPYWGLRKYAGLPDLVWGGKEDCQHQFNLPTSAVQGNNSMVRGKDEIDSGKFAIPKFKDTDMKQRKEVVGAFCSLCGAWQGQLGLEPTPELFIAHLVEICREVRRVMRNDGVCFLNIGDSYAGSGKGQNADGSPGKSGKLQKSNKGTQIGGIPVSRFDKWNNDTPNSVQVSHDTSKANYNGLKPKDLCLIPFRLAIALQEDGWWVRSVIIWNKPNPMPESVTDRPSESHEYILMLTKSARYYYDQEAVREPLQPSSVERSQYDVGFFDKRLKANPDDWNDPRRLYGFPQKRGYKSKHGTTFGEQEQFHGQDINSYPSGRNMRSVWEFSTQSYKEAHFATYPEELVKRCVLAATPEAGCCSKCGKAWVRVIKPSDEYEKLLGTWTPDTDTDPELRAEIGFAAHGKKVATTASYQTLGWKSQCKCGLPQSENIGSIVLDPFAGSCTSLSVAKRLGRRAIGYELSKQYCALGVKRIETETAPMRLE